MRKVLLHLMSRRSISLLMACLLIVYVFVVIPPTSIEEPEEEKAPKQIIETEPYHTDVDYSLLYSLKEQKTKDDIIELTYPEAVALMKIGRCEGGDSIDGQAAVMAVIINRIKTDNPDFKDIETVGQAIYQSGQFSTVDAGAFDSAIPNTNSHLALAQIESGIDITDGALWFESSSNSNDSWHKRNLTFICEISGNLFYK